MYLYIKKCLDTSKFRQTSDILLWIEEVHSWLYFQYYFTIVKVESYERANIKLKNAPQDKYYVSFEYA
jgi:hypothetical protein